MQKHNVKIRKIDVQSLLNLFNENLVREDTFFNNLVFFISQDYSAVEKVDTKKTESEACMYSVKKQLYALSITKVDFACDGVLSRET